MCNKKNQVKPLPLNIPIIWAHLFYRQFCQSWRCTKLYCTLFTGKITDTLGYLKNTHKIPKSETSPNQGTWLGIPWLGLVSVCQIWDFYGYSLSTLKYPKMGICYLSCDSTNLHFCYADTLICSFGVCVMEVSL